MLFSSKTGSFSSGRLFPFFNLPPPSTSTIFPYTTNPLKTPFHVFSFALAPLSDAIAKDTGRKIATIPLRSSSYFSSHSYLRFGWTKTRARFLSSWWRWFVNAKFKLSWSHTLTQLLPQSHFPYLPSSSQCSNPMTRGNVSKKSK